MSSQHSYVLYRDSFSIIILFFYYYFYYILKAFKSFMPSFTMTTPGKHWGEFVQFIKSLSPAIPAASCSWTSKWFSHYKQWEGAPLYNIDSDPEKLRDLRNYSLLHQLRYTTTIVFQSFQGPVTTWNPHRQKANKRNTHKTKTQQTYLKNPLPCEHLFSTEELQLQACPKAMDTRLGKSRQ